MLLDRMGLPAENGWYDDGGRVCIYYTVNEICSTSTTDAQAGQSSSPDTIKAPHSSQVSLTKKAAIL